MNKIELFANNLDITLLKTALIDLRDKVTTGGDTYEVSQNLRDLLSQLDELGI
jgi:hypothetical protein